MITRGLKLNAQVRELLKLPEIQDITDQLPKHPSKKWPRRTLESIKMIVQHHTASEAPLINQAKYHISAHSWAGLAYTFVIDRGRIYQTNDLSSLTSHALGVNPISVGVCINGDLSKRPLTDFERKALTAIHFTLRELLQDVELLGHNEASKKYANHRTSCPCTDMNRLRTDLEALEEEMSYKDSDAAISAEVFAFFERFNALGNRMNDAKYGAESRRKIMLMAPYMPDLGVEGDVTPDMVLSRLKDLRSEAIVNGKWTADGLQKASFGAKYAKQAGILV